jgi:uncharacterized protein
MKCPQCQTDLQMTERQGIEIDYCPDCRGIWLDRGELDKLIERSAAYTAGGPAPRQSEKTSRGYERERESEHRPRKKESFWSELFDFG